MYIKNRPRFTVKPPLVGQIHLVKWSRFFHCLPQSASKATLTDFHIPTFSFQCTMMLPECGVYDSIGNDALNGCNHISHNVALCKQKLIMFRVVGKTVRGGV